MMKIIRAVYAGALFLSLWFVQTNTAAAEVDVNINIGTPPVLAINAPPAVVVIPGTYAYMVPDISVDIIFYHGYWYRPYKDRWFISGSYNGPWEYIVRERTPVVILNLPPGYRNMPPGHSRIPYGQLKKNWKSWEEKKYWDDKHRGSGHKSRDQRKRDKGKHR